jgi:hypothetical protein
MKQFIKIDINKFVNALEELSAPKRCWHITVIAAYNGKVCVKNVHGLEYALDHAGIEYTLSDDNIYLD